MKTRYPQALARYWVKSMSISLTKAIKKHGKFENFTLRPVGRHHGDHPSYYAGAAAATRPAKLPTKGYLTAGDATQEAASGGDTV